ncbi:chymotrypsin-2 [Eupeodes corollae]|uniref:chymotrypsin-2 n=1 Tax=Eupeodes corollae TaxID=290404 RepID=UPI002491274C|nr:chymotrypsin-2 [Eupeodes corollae]
MIRKFCRIFCVVFLIADFQSSQSQFDNNRKNHLIPSNINGPLSLPDDALHQASIRLINKDITFGEGHICSGSLISTRVVLTAARCLFNLDFKTPRHPSELIVVMGTSDRYQRTLDTVTSGITHIRYPTSFDLESMRDDIGLLFLSREIPEKHSTIRPIELNWKITDNYVRGSVTGWDLSKNGDLSRQLLIANVSILDRNNCKHNVEQLLITKRMICGRYMREMDKRIYQSDVGAPLVIAGKQIGLASITMSNYSTLSDKLVIYTDVAYHKEWIWTELRDENNNDSSVWGLLGFLILTWFAFREKQKLSFRLCL